MTEDVRAEMETERYQAWALRNPIDDRKITLELDGQRRPTADSPYARILIRDIRSVTKPQALAPSPSSPLASIWQADGVFTRSLSSFFGEKRKAARAAGFKVMYVHLDHTDLSTANRNEMGLLDAERRATGWLGWVGWATYGQGTDAEQDGLRAASTAAELGLAGWKANGEAWAEGADSGKTGAFLAAWKRAGAPCPLGWSVLSSDTSSFARSFDYVAALSAEGADIDLQVYGATNANYTVEAGLGMLRKATVPVGRTAMTFDVKAGSGDGPFGDYRTWPGPRRLWTGDDATADTFSRLARA